jgi:fructan beta-fructosidase
MIRPLVLLTILLLPLGVHADDAPDPYRPRLHFSAPDDWINDPNGLFRVGGEWHMQFQYKWPRNWGHAKSTDLLHWEFLPLTLTPDAVGDVWSGCTVRDEHNTSGLFAPGKGGLVSVYASWKKPLQHISLAFSADEGATWQRPPGNPVIDPNKKDFRDPKVLWHEPSKRWSMVVAAGRRLEFFTSQNLQDWSPTGTFETPLRPAQVFECPDLFPLPVEGRAGQEKWVLVSSFIENKACETRYWIGEFDGAQFHSEMAEPLLLGNGPDDYAGITWPRDPASGRTVLIAWMNTWTYAGKPPTKPWQGCMTLPRELTLHATPGGGWEIHQAPVRELATALHEKTDTSLASLSTGERHVLSREETGAMRATLRPEPEAVVEFELFASASGKTVVGYDAVRRMIYFDRRESGGPAVHESFPTRREAPLALADNGSLDLQIVWDRSTVEVFAGDGAVYLSGLVFPTPGTSEVAVVARTGRVAVTSLKVQGLK